MQNPDCFYSSEAYSPENIPDLPSSRKRSWLSKVVSVRLPWGQTQEVLPSCMLTSVKPDYLRYMERQEQIIEERRSNGEHVDILLEDVELHYRVNNEVVRFAQLHAGSKIWIIMRAFGQVGALAIFPLMAFVNTIIVNYKSEFWLDRLLRGYLDVFLFFLLPSLLMWGIGWFVIYRLPKFWLRPSKGPLWEFNRRTGMVTVFDYDNNGKYKSEGVIGEKSAPFYEFDAYVTATPDRMGIPNNVLFIAHRYTDTGINMANFVLPDNSPEVPCALWDFFQNYMDITKPLPDIPELEPYRYLDPTTAEYDQKTGRNPRYWRDMDDETFEAKVREMDARIPEINTFDRPNLMARHVIYED